MLETAGPHQPGIFMNLKQLVTGMTINFGQKFY